MPGSTAGNSVPRVLSVLSHCSKSLRVIPYETLQGDVFVVL
jgi:hypothetical protein